MSYENLYRIVFEHGRERIVDLAGRYACHRLRNPATSTRVIGCP